VDGCRNKRRLNVRALKKFLGWPIASDVSVAKFGQISAYVVALGFLVLAIRKFVTLELTEAELFFGILLVMTLFLLTICVGTLARIEAELTKRDDSR
jgi:hypothetical protein